MIEALGFEFFRNAVFAGVLAGIACGIIGTIVVVNRIVFVSGGIAHAAYGGIGLAFFLGFSPVLGSLAFSVAVALVIAQITLTDNDRADTIIGVIWAVGMAFGIILLDLTPGYNTDLMSYLFGSILAVPRVEIYGMIALDALTLALVWYFYRDILAFSYDREFAKASGVPVRPLYFMLMVLAALAVVMVIRVVGLILVIALMTIPPYIAGRHSRSLAKMMGVASLLSILFTLAGLVFSYYLNLTSGATIILVAALVFALDLALFRRGRV